MCAKHTKFDKMVGSGQGKYRKGEDAELDAHFDAKFREELQRQHGKTFEQMQAEGQAVEHMRENFYRENDGGNMWGKDLKEEFYKNKKGVADAAVAAAEQQALAPPDLTDGALLLSRKAQATRTRQGGGRSSSFLTGPQGLSSAVPGKRKSLLGL